MKVSGMKQKVEDELKEKDERDKPGKEGRVGKGIERKENEVSEVRTKKIVYGNQRKGKGKNEKSNDMDDC